MNPFSAFLQPSYAPTDLSPINQAVDTMDKRARDARDFKQRQLENTQQTTRADQRFAMEKAYQDKKFEAADSEESDSLVAEYTDAVARGDQVGIANALQKLQRHGADVQHGGDPPPANLQDFNGTKPPSLPGMAQLGNPIDEAIKTELGTRDKLRQKFSQPQGDLSQQDFEAQLINDSTAGSYSAGKEPDIAGHLRSVGGLPALPLNTRAQQDASGSAAPAPSGQADGAVMDLGSPGEVEKMKADYARSHPGEPEQAEQGAQPPRLATQSLPTLTRISKNGRQLYEGPQGMGSLAQFASDVFAPYTQSANPQIAEAAKKAQQLAATLMSNATVTPKQALDFAFNQFKQETAGINSLARAEIMRRPRAGGGGAGGAGSLTDPNSYAMGPSGKADAALNDDLDKVRTMWVNSAGYKKLEEQAANLDDAEGGLLSPDGVSQNNALATLRRIQSGLTLNAQEMRDFEGAAGYVEAIKKKFERYLGQGELPEEYKRQVLGAMTRMRQVVRNRFQRSANEAYEYFKGSRSAAASPDIIEKKAGALKKSLLGGSNLAPAPAPEQLKQLWEE